MLSRSVQRARRLTAMSEQMLECISCQCSVGVGVAVQKRGYKYKGVYMFPGPGRNQFDDGAQKPDGVPETWTTLDIGSPWTDCGYFDEDTFPPAKEGETLEQYCRRVPNIWSPCSKSSDVVDVMVYVDMFWAQDKAPPLLSLIEEPLIKIPPESADWHVTYEPDYEAMLRDMMFRTRPFPVKVTDKEFDVMLAEFRRGVEDRGIGYHFTARSFHEFWEQLTGKDLKLIANVPTWEEEIERRIEQAKARIANEEREQISHH